METDPPSGFVTWVPVDVPALHKRITDLREQALSDYRDCKEEGSHADAARYDCVASTLNVVLGLLEPPK